MTEKSQSGESGLADRLVNYADGLVAVAFLGVSGLGVIVADPDIRCSIQDALIEICVVNFVTTMIIAGAIYWLRIWELDLRSDDLRSEKVVTYSRWLHLTRFGIVWISFFLSVAIAIPALSGDCGELDTRTVENVMSVAELDRNSCGGGDLTRILGLGPVNITASTVPDEARGHGSFL